MKPDFSGYVTKAGLKCTDGRTIMPGAFKHQDGSKVPLVYQHNHDDHSQVMGHVILHDRPDGTWGEAFLNKDTLAGQNAKALVMHGDLDKFSIWAKNLVERGLDVHSGDIQEVSLVLAGANAGARVSNVLAHSDFDDDEEMMIVGFELTHADADEDGDKDESDDGESKDNPTVEDVLDTLSDDQRKAVNSVIDGIVTEAIAEALEEEPQIQHDNLDSSKKGNEMSRNVFDQTKNDQKELKHSDVSSILSAAKGPGGEGGSGAVASLRDLVRSDSGRELMHAADYGVENLEILFPDAKNIQNSPTFVDRRQDWVKAFMNGTRHTPFSRIKTMYADITAEEARAKGYLKGNEKIEEFFPVFKRTTGPGWVYKKQKLDRQDIIDITDFDVVAWMKAEMRGKLDEEIARAAMFGDGRDVTDPDKIQEPTGNSGDGIRAIINEPSLYKTDIAVVLPASPSGADWNALLDAVPAAREGYMGSGNLTAFMTYSQAASLLTIRDEFGHRMYRNLSEVAGDMDVSSIVRVPTALMPDDVLAIVLDLSDYNFGTNRGGEITLFDDFDIDFNQYKYLMETYLSGALVLPYSAQVYRKVTSASVTATAPTFVDGEDGTGVITVPKVTGVIYKIGGQPQPSGTVDVTDETVVTAVASPGYTLAAGTSSWTFTPTDV